MCYEAKPRNTLKFTAWIVLESKNHGIRLNLIGFELYCKMIDDAVRDLKQEVQEVEEFTPEINIPINAFVPDDYIQDETSKLLTYKRLSRIKDEVELSEMKEELIDRYGTLPEPLENLLEIISLRIFLMRIRVKRLEYSGKQVTVHVTESTPLRMDKLLKLVKEDKGMAKILPDGKIMLRIDSDSRENVATPQARRNLSSEHGEPGTRLRVREAPAALPQEGATRAPGIELRNKPGRKMLLMNWLSSKAYFLSKSFGGFFSSMGGGFSARPLTAAIMSSASASSTGAQRTEMSR